MARINDESIERYREYLADCKKLRSGALKEAQHQGNEVIEVAKLIYSYETGIYEGDKITFTREPSPHTLSIRKPLPLVTHGFAVLRCDYDGKAFLCYYIMLKSGKPGKHLKRFYDTSGINMTQYVEND